MKGVTIVNDDRKIVHAAASTDPVLSTREYVVSFDMCARLNALIDPRWSSFKLFISVPFEKSAVRVINLRPSLTRPGFINVLGDTVKHGQQTFEVGAGNIFRLYFV